MMRGRNVAGWVTDWVGSEGLGVVRPVALTPALSHREREDLVPSPSSEKTSAVRSPLPLGEG
jgi:hypothetical protein